MADRSSMACDLAQHSMGNGIGLAVCNHRAAKRSAELRSGIAEPVGRDLTLTFCLFLIYMLMQTSGTALIHKTARLC